MEGRTGLLNSEENTYKIVRTATLFILSFFVCVFCVFLFVLSACFMSFFLFVFVLLFFFYFLL